LNEKTKVNKATWSDGFGCDGGLFDVGCFHQCGPLYDPTACSRHRALCIACLYFCSCSSTFGRHLLTAFSPQPCQEPGGSYVYASRGLNPYLGFVASFSQWFGLSIVIGVVAYVTVPFLRDIAFAMEWNLW
jgi:hypothetical protein